MFGNNVKSLSLAALLILSCIPLYAGWFGPGKSDKAKVTIVPISGKCDPGGYAFEVRNNSEYTINKVTFKVSGEITGRSTKYDLRNGYEDFESDIILLPYKSAPGCWVLNQQNWPKGESLKLSTEITSVEFKVKDDTETVY